MATFDSPAGATVGTAAARVYDEIKQRLVRGGWAPGMRISIAPLAAELGVSKQPIMDAMRQLSADGLIVIVPQVGCVVESYDSREISDFFRVFADAEARTTAAAAVRRDTAGILRIEEASRRLESLGRDHTPETADAYWHLNRAFHSEIHAMAQSRLLSDLGRRMWDLCDFFLYQSTSRPVAGALGDRHDEHDEIVSAIRAGDADRAAQATKNHIMLTLEFLDSSLRQ